ncbi:MAG: PQQ-binding-like beta-propeller repeat protein [Planctomycetaceae bacterium]|nr:PQQ-binding-like beta-propeller repeat protein [Planctomycetaceae bacterium]
MARCSRSLLVVVSITLLSAAAQAENWPQWRGERLDGISGEKGLPTKWSKTENVLWRLPLPGQAGATPAIWGERIFLTSVAGKDLVLLCVGTDGKEQWRQVVATGNQTVRGDEGNYASPSPSTDGKHVWTFMGTGDLACYTVDGKEVWKLNVEDRYGQIKLQFGMASTPVLDRATAGEGGRLYLQLIHGDYKVDTQEAKVVCLDAATGSEVWAVDRKSDGRHECEHSYASPILYRDGEREFLLTHGNDYIVAHDLADGHELWRCGDLNPKGSYNETLRFVASPVAVPGMIVVPSAKHKGVLCLKPNGSGNITDKPEFSHWRWKKDTTDVPSPLILGDTVYICDEDGFFAAADAKTGQVIFREPTTRDRHRASPLYADGHIYLTARKGIVTVVKAGREFEVVATNDMQEPITASPVVSGGRIYLRSFDALYAIGSK